jgi:hypothetical protein
LLYNGGIFVIKEFGVVFESFKQLRLVNYNADCRGVKLGQDGDFSFDNCDGQIVEGLEAVFFDDEIRAILREFQGKLQVL